VKTLVFFTENAQISKKQNNWQKAGDTVGEGDFQNPNHASGTSDFWSLLRVPSVVIREKNEK
jgi:hypothetical protein